MIKPSSRSAAPPPLTKGNGQRFMQGLREIAKPITRAAILSLGTCAARCDQRAGYSQEISSEVVNFHVFPGKHLDFGKPTTRC